MTRPPKQWRGRRSIQSLIIEKWAGEVCPPCGKLSYRNAHEAECCARELRLRVLGREPLWAYACVYRDVWHLTRQAPKGGGRRAGPF